MSILRYLFEPLPVPVGYDNPKVQVLLLLCAGLLLLSLLLRIWRRSTSNPATRKLSRSWPSACLWFAIVGLVLVVARTEDMSILSMRFLWVLWLGSLVGFVFLQFRFFRLHHYEALPVLRVEDPRERYLPKPKKR